MPQNLLTYYFHTLSSVHPHFCARRIRYKRVKNSRLGLQLTVIKMFGAAAMKPALVAAGALAGFFGLGYIASRGRPASSAGLVSFQQTDSGRPPGHSARASVAGTRGWPYVWTNSTLGITALGLVACMQ